MSCLGPIFFTEEDRNADEVVDPFSQWLKENRFL